MYGLFGNMNRMMTRPPIDIKKVNRRIRYALGEDYNREADLLRKESEAQDVQEPVRDSLKSINFEASYEPVKPAQKPSESTPQKDMSPLDIISNLDRDGLVTGIILSEILGKPRALRRHESRYSHR